MRIGHHLVSLASSTVTPAGEQWVHLFPAGTVSGRDGRGPWRLDDPAGVIEQTRRYAGTQQLAVDYDHAIDLATPKGGQAIAAGWIKGLQARDDGIWGLVTWTARASAMLKAREYRYLSPVFKHKVDGRITVLLRAALTNNPNLELTALASAGGTMDLLTQLRQLLALDDNASDEDVLAAVRQLTDGAGAVATAAAEPDPAKFVPIGEFQKVTAELNRVHKGVSVLAATDTVEAEIDRGRLPPFLKDWGITLCSANKPAFDAFVRATGSGLSDLFKPSGLGMKSPRDRDSAGGLSPDERAICAQLGITPEEFARHNGSNR